MTRNRSDIFSFNATESSNITMTKINQSEVVTPHVVSMYTGPPPQGLPVPLLIASPVAAVSILIFICLAYYCHAAQLDSRARQLAIKMASTKTLMEFPKSRTKTSILSSSDSEVSYHTPRRSTMRATSLTPSMAIGPKTSRCSAANWSAISDKELVISAPRRHSTFII